jgi:hypothetical protein
MALDPDPTVLFNGSVASTGLATAHTVSTTEKTRLNEIIIGNGAGASRSIDIHFVASGDAADATNLLWPAFKVPQAIPAIFPMNTWLMEGDMIVVSASGTSVALHISAMEKLTA